MDSVNYCATTSADEWANEILHADRLLVEGFEERWLRKRAEDLGRTPDPQCRGFKVLAEFLVGLGLDDDRASDRVGDQLCGSFV